MLASSLRCDAVKYTAVPVSERLEKELAIMSRGSFSCNCWHCPLEMEFRGTSWIQSTCMWLTFSAGLTLPVCHPPVVICSFYFCYLFVFIVTWSNTLSFTYTINTNAAGVIITVSSLRQSCPLMFRCWWCQSSLKESEFRALIKYVGSDCQKWRTHSLSLTQTHEESNICCKIKMHTCLTLKGFPKLWH